MHVCMHVHVYVCTVCVHVHTYVCMYGILHKKLDDERRSNCVHTVTDWALTAVRTGVVCAYAVFSLADAFAIGLWLLPLNLATKFATLHS